MTVIMGLTLGNAAAVLGDALITAKGKVATKFEMPTVEDANPHLRKFGVHVPALRQKVNILRKDVIVAWAGVFEAAHEFLLELSESLDAGCSPEYVVELLKSWPEEQKKLFTIIALIRGPQTTRLVWDGKILQLSSEIFRSATVSGSGAFAVQELISRFEQSDARASEELADPLKLILYSMALGAQATGLELLTQWNLENRWGGAIETAIFNKGEATKVGEILYAFFEAETNTMELKLYPTFIKQEYQGDLLVTHTLSDHEAPRTIAIPPTLSDYKKGERIEVKTPRLTYDWLCTCVLIREGGYPIDIFATVELFHLDRPVNFTWKQSLLPDPKEGGRHFPSYSSSVQASVKRTYMDDIAGQVTRYAKILPKPASGDESREAR
jgi:hypothetical protein